MEFAILVIIGLVAVVYFGFDNSIEAGARMANRKVTRLEDEQIRENAAWYDKNHISDELMDKALASKAKYDSYRNL